MGLAFEAFRGRRRGVGVALVAAVALVLVGCGDGSKTGDAGAPAAGPPIVRLIVDGRSVARLDIARFERSGRLDAAALRRRVIALLPAAQVERRGRARITMRYDRELTADRAVAAAARVGGDVAVARTAVASRVRVPILRQMLRNNCESAALSILFAGLGKRVDQLRIQAAFPRSGPLDPQGIGPARVWGDPDRGYVGRPEGGGAAGGFGVYPGPVQSTAARLGVTLTNLTGSSPQAVYERLLDGRPVMAWIGLSDGPYGRWRSPMGKRITVNFGEHTVVLYGVHANGDVRVSNPLEGTDERWSRAVFERKWRLLERRALAA